VWNSLVEETVERTSAAGPIKIKKSNAIDLASLEGETTEGIARYLSTIGELDRVLGGGIVPGSAVLVGGDPGIGKSTLLLQMVAALSQNVMPLYISGEEAVAQVRLRAQRLGISKANVQLASATNVRDILATIESNPNIKIVVIDSIQTMYIDALDSAPGTVSQVRASAQELIRVAKKRDISMIMVGHVTKEGTLAGPRVLEHMVDTVLYFEGDRGHQFRILRSVKNRFGPANEIGVFEMTQGGLDPVENPSALFLGQRLGDVSGTVVFAGIEGTRPVLVELQALVAPSPLATPRRAVVGWDQARLSMILAVLEARCGISFAGKDVYLNVAGGLRINEPAADLAVAAALLSATTGVPLPPNTVVFGEIGLSGEVRAVNQMDARLKEAAKLGFEGAFMPQSVKSKTNPEANDLLETKEIRFLMDMATYFVSAAQLGKQQTKQVNA
jgi:DNA repair protein RadA/Sms